MIELNRTSGPQGLDSNTIESLQAENERLRAFVNAVAVGRHDEFCGPRVSDCRCSRGQARETLRT